MNVGRLAARVIIGGLFIGHGTQKLKGWFGGPGIEGTAGMMESLEMHPPRRNALVAGTAETVGGAMLAAGAATPLASAALIGPMITAIRKVHLPKGPWVMEGGYEYNLVLIAALTALADHGPGRPSIDGDRFHGTFWALASLGAGIAGSYLATSPVVSEEPPAEPTGRFTRDAEPVATSVRRKTEMRRGAARSS
jgi:putative oxidoreductase